MKKIWQNYLETSAPYSFFENWWIEEKNNKKVLLECYDITSFSVSIFMEETAKKIHNPGLGNRSFETFLIEILFRGIEIALRNAHSKVDISDMFEIELFYIKDRKTYCVKQEKIQDYLLNTIFNTVYENDEELIVALKKL